VRIYQKNTEHLSSSPSFLLSKPSRQKFPVVISSPHSGRCYSPEFQQMARVSVAGLERSEDRFVDLLVCEIVDLGIPVLAANFPRSYVDLNRSPTDLDSQLISGISRIFSQKTITERMRQGLGVVPRIAGSGAEIYDQLLPMAEVRRRLLCCYFPYHKMLRGLLSATRERFGFAVLIDFHSMPSKAVDKGSSIAHTVVLGDAFGKSALSNVVDEAAVIFSDLGYRVLRNKPYAGGFITQHYGQPGEGVSVLQIEISRAAYMDEQTLKPRRNFDRVKADVSLFVSTFADRLTLEQAAE
jgi:N-formylglutamate amidohydrolase